MLLRLPEPVARALDDLRVALRALFGARLKRLVLFGSYARGTVHEDSDVDVLVVVDPALEGDGHRAADAATEIMVRRPEVVLSPLVMSVAQLDELRARERRFARDIDMEGIPL